MVKTTVYLDLETALALRQMAESQARPQAELIREALFGYTRQRPRRRLKGVGKYRSGRSDVSEKAEQLLAAGFKR